MLLIAPRTDLLYVDEEVMAVVNLLRPRILIGNVTAAQVLEEMQRQAWRIIWFATHGDINGIWLSDGQLGQAELTPFLRNNIPELVYFNTCSSMQVAMAIHNEVQAEFVATVVDIPDRTAFFTGRQFAYHISRGAGYHEAYLAAKPGQNREYIYLPGRPGKRPVQDGRQTKGMDMDHPPGGGDYERRIVRVETELRYFREDFTRFRSGVERQLESQNETIHEGFQEIKRAIGSGAPQTDPKQWAFVIMGVGGGLALVAVLLFLVLRMMAGGGL